jgi:dimethylglycine dehydrogenase
MDRFIAWKKPDAFIGRAAAEAERKAPPDRVLCNFEVAAKDADVVAYEPIFVGEKVVGFCTSGGYSHHLGKSIAMGFLPRDMAKAGAKVQIEILGDMCDAVVVTEPEFDPDGTRLRG